MSDQRQKPHAFTHRFVGFLLAGVFGGFGRVTADLHMHGIDDVIEVLHHCHPLQRRAVWSQDPIHTLEAQTQDTDLTVTILHQHTSTHTLCSKRLN